MGFLMSDTCLADTAVLAATSVLLLYWWSTSTFHYWGKRGVRTVSKVTPLLGSLKDIVSLKTQFGLHFQSLYQDLEGERFGGYFKLRQPAILLRDPELIKHILLKDFASFVDNDIDANENSNPMLAFNLFGMKGAKWKYARSKISPIFSTGKIHVMYPLIMEVCEELKANLQRRIESKNPEFEAKNLAANYTTDVVASCAFALKCNSLQDDNNNFRKMGREIMNPSAIRGLLTMVAFFIPSMGSILSFFGVKFISNEIVNFFRGLVREAMEFREKNDVRRNDLIQLLMQLKKMGSLEGEGEGEAKNGTAGGEVKEEARTKMEFTHDVLTAQAVSFFIDGFETSSITLSFALHELAVNPEIQTRLRAELRKYVDKNDGKLTYDTLKECAYLDCVVQETLRKYPPGGALAKICTQRYTIPGSDVTIEPGTPVSIPVYALHHDPQYYPDPDTFDPERFNEENKKNIAPFTFLPFGEGPRQCIGMRFALAQVKAALATITLNFEVTRSDKTQHPVVLDPNYFMPSAKGGLHLNVKPITV